MIIQYKDDNILRIRINRSLCKTPLRKVKSNIDSNMNYGFLCKDIASLFGNKTNFSVLCYDEQFVWITVLEEKGYDFLLGVKIDNSALIDPSHPSALLPFMGTKMPVDKKENNFFCPIERVKEKQASRDQDAKELAEGKISVKELRERNAAFRIVAFDIFGAKK